jgi:hypothetical protein
MAEEPKQENAVRKNVWVLFVGIIVGSVSIFVGQAARDLLESLLQITTPMNDRIIRNGTVMVVYRLLYFFIIFAILAALMICIVSAIPR